LDDGNDHRPACEHGRLVVASLPPATTSELDEIGAVLSGLLRQDVTIAPMRLPPVCASVWIGCGKTDHIFRNQDWPIPAIEPIAHATGHLALRHCGTVRDGGQFTCMQARDLELTHPGQIRAILHDPGTRPCRLFTDAEEHEAESFAAFLWHHLGREPPHARRELAGNPAFTCIG